MWIHPWDKIKTADKNTARLMEFNRLNYIIIYLKNQSNPHRPPASAATRPHTAQFNYRLYCPAKFRNFYKIPHKNNREFDFTKQGFCPPISGNNPTPPPPRYRLSFIWLLLEKLCDFIYSFEYKYKNLLPILTTDCIYSHE